MTTGFPPQPTYPLALDTDYTLFSVFNTTQTTLSANNQPWSEEVLINPVAADKPEIWADNGFANVSGELFYYDSVDKNGDDKVYRLKSCVRNLGGSQTRHNPSGTPVRAFVVAEHHTQIAEAILAAEDFVGITDSPDVATLDYRIRHLSAEPPVFDDFLCPDVDFFFDVVSVDPVQGTLVSYSVTINGTGTFALQFGDGSATTTQPVGTHLYPPNAAIDPVVVLTNDQCQIVQTPITRGNTAEPQIQPETPPFIVAGPTTPVLPPLVIPPLTVPSLDIFIPPIVFPCLSIGPFPGINIPSIIFIEPPIPAIIEFGPVDIPAFIAIEFGGIPDFPDIGFGPLPDFPDINFGIAPAFPDIGFGPVPNISISFPQITFGPFPEVPNIEFGVFPTVPNIEFGTFPELPSIGFAPVPSFPSIVFGQVPTFPSIVFGPVPHISFASFPTVPSIGFGTPPVVSVTWGTPPSVTCTCSVACPTGSPFAMAPPAPGAIGLGQADPSFNQNLEVEYDLVGFPSIIHIAPPDIKPITIKHDIPDFISLKMPDLEVKVVSDLPKEIRLVAPDKFVSVITFEIPPPIVVDASGIPTSIALELKEPPVMRLDTSSLPEHIQVVGIPSSIRLEVPEAIMLGIPEDFYVPMKFDGPPISVQINLGVDKSLEDDGLPCFRFVACPRK